MWIVWENMNCVKKCEFCWKCEFIQKCELREKLWIMLENLNFGEMWILLISEFCYFQYLPGKSEAIFSRSSSTSGTDSSIRIRKAREGCTERRWFISVSLALIFTVLVASAGIYFGCKLNFLKLDFWKLKR